jgi:O-antigen/teichoic acid export membrane protein
VINVLVVRAVAWWALRDSGGPPPRVDLAGVQRIWRFSAGLAVTAVIAVVFLQSDKVILGKIVPLADLGRYTLAWIAARSLYVLTAPTFSAIYPQMSSLHAAGDLQEITQLYRLGTRLLTAVLFPAAVFLAMFSTTIFTFWTGDAQLAKSLTLVVAWLLLGTALNSAMHFPYALQLAFGKSSLPMAINITLLMVFMPLLVLLSLRFGIVGAAAAWAILNVLYLFLGTWLTHRHMLQGIGLNWLCGDVGVPLLVSLGIVGGGGIALRFLDLAPSAAAAIGIVFAGLAFVATFLLTPGLADFAWRTFGPRPQFLGAKA